MERRSRGGSEAAQQASGHAMTGITYKKGTQMTQPRKPSGTPEGGRWAPTEHAEGDYDLAPPGVRPELVAAVAAHPRDLDPRLIWEASPAEVDWLLEHGSSTHVCSLADRDDLTKEQYMKLLDSDRPISARVDVASKVLVIEGLAEKASKDPSPVVRALALAYGWDLSARRRQELMDDPEVIRMAQKLGLDLG